MFRYLYYPSMALPNNAWLRRVLLYSDKISSIVPYDIQGSLKNKINFLEAENEFEMLTPELFFENYSSAREFESEVIDYLNSNKFHTISNDKPKVNFSEFHNSKFSYQIMNTLHQHSILKDIDGIWYKLPHNVGTIYMGILAKYIARENDYVPTTNLISNQDLIFNSLSVAKEIQVGELLLIRALPTPTFENSIESIINFKKQRKVELYRFRKILRDYATKISLSETEQDILNLTQEFKEELEIGLDDITRLLDERKISFKLNSLNTLIHLKNPTIFGTLGNIYTNISDISPIIGTTIGGCIGLGLKHIESRLKVNEQINNSPYGYVFHTKKLQKNTPRIFSSLL